MSYPPRRSDTEPPEAPQPIERTDFQSLTSVQAPVREPVATDFQSLRDSVETGRRHFQQRTLTDWLVDILTPIMIFIMVLSVVQFLLDVRSAFTSAFEENLRFVAICFVVGVVALNRLVARDGKEQSVLYIIGLGMTVTLYTVAMTSFYGAPVAGGFLDATGVALFFNLGVVGFVWWVANRLTHECCVDTKPVSGEIGILTGTARLVRKSLGKQATSKPATPTGKREKKNTDVFPSMELEPIDPSEWKKPEQQQAPPPLSAAERLPKRHPGISIFYFSIPVMLIFGLGLRALLAEGTLAVRKGHLYVSAYTLSALTLLMLTSLGGLREYFRFRRVRIPAGIGPFWVGLGAVMIVAVFIGAGTLPLPAFPRPAIIDDSGGIIDSQSYLKYKYGDLGVSPAAVLRQNTAFNRIGRGVIVILALFLAYGLLRTCGAAAAAFVRKHEHLPRWLIRLLEFIDRLLQKFTKFPSLKMPKRRPRISRRVALSVNYTNPLGDPERSESMSVADQIEYAYQALCALAADLGTPRREDQTPYEFIESFPGALATLRDEATGLTDLYVRSAYSPQALDETALDCVRKFWYNFRRVRNKVVR